MTSDQVITDIREALEAGPYEGPWTVEEFQHDGRPCALLVSAGGTIIAEIRGYIDSCGNGENARFIAACNPRNISVLLAALQSAAGTPAPQPPETHVEQWKPWIDMPAGDQRGVVREVRSENGETALAYWTGKFMALAPVSDNPVPLPFKIWGQRPAPETIVVANTGLLPPDLDPHFRVDEHGIIWDRLTGENVTEILRARRDATATEVGR